MYFVRMNPLRVVGKSYQMDGLEAATAENVIITEDGEYIVTMKPGTTYVIPPKMCGGKEWRTVLLNTLGAICTGPVSTLRDVVSFNRMFSAAKTVYVFGGPKWARR